MNAGDKSAWRQSELDRERAAKMAETFVQPSQEWYEKLPEIPVSPPTFTSPLRVDYVEIGGEKIVRITVHPAYVIAMGRVPYMDFDHVMADRLASQIQAAAKVARGELE